MFLATVIGIFVALLFITSSAHIKPEYVPYVKKKSLVPVALIAVLALIVGVGFAVSSVFFRAKTYSNIIDVDDTKSFASDIAEADFSSVPVLDNDSAKALANREKRTYRCKTMDEITEAIKANGDGFVHAMWCGDEECEKKVKETTGIGSRCVPFDQEHVSDTCVCCGREAKKMVLWAIAY